MCDPVFGQISVTYRNNRTNFNDTALWPEGTPLSDVIAKYEGTSFDSSTSQVTLNGESVAVVNSVVLTGNAARISILPSKTPGA